MTKQLYLGTANWGRSVSKNDALALLDVFYGHGYKLVDSATNYPINSRSQDYSLALTWIAEWLDSNRNSRLEIFVKVGSINNKGTSENDLGPSEVTEQVIKLQSKFGDNLLGVGIHWDNRDFSYKHEIFDLVSCLNQLSQGDLQLGISGIKYPEVYYLTSEIGSEWLIQVKEYLGFSLKRERYAAYFPSNRYIAYGISHYLNRLWHDSNVKFDELLRKNQYLDCLRYVSNNPALHGCIVGPRNVNQLMDIVEYWRNH
jgi:aryl-alcohol dehydrogenase-like predicted oxidoreductase